MTSQDWSSFGATLSDALGQLGRRLGFTGSSPDFSPRRAVLVHLAVLAVFGIWLPTQKGSEFLDAVILGSYACLGVLFAAPIAASPFPENSGVASAAIGRTLVCVGYGLLVTVTMLVMGLVTVYSAHTIFMGADLISLAECLLFGTMLSVALTTAVVWTTVRFSSFAAKTLARFSFMGLLAAFFFWSRWLPDVALQGAGIAAVGATAGFGLLAKLGNHAQAPSADTQPFNI